MSIYQIAWGITLILVGLPFVGVTFSALPLLTGVALIVSGIAFIAGK